MEAMAKLAAVGVTAVVLSAVLRKNTPELALLLALTAGIWMMALAAEGLGAVVAMMEELAEQAGLSEVLLEPVVELKVTVPDNYMGDVLGDLNKRRGRVMDMQPIGGGQQTITAEAPMAEMMTYAIDLRAMTQSRGSYVQRFVRYEECPGPAQEKAIAAAKAMAEE